MSLTCAHPDCTTPAVIIARSPVGNLAVCDEHFDAMLEEDEHGQLRFAAWMRDAATRSEIVA